jgi:hypothetical protein
MKHPLLILTIITVLLSTILVIWVAFLYIYPIKVIEIKNAQNVPVDKTVYKGGDRIAYTLDYCKYTNTPAVVTRTIVDGFRISFGSFNSNMKAGCANRATNDLVIPEFLPSGVYHLEGTGTYRVNILRDFIVNWRTVDFQVVNEEL